MNRASLVVDYDESLVTAGDINVYAPESAVRGAVGDTGTFGGTQRMIYWHHGWHTDVYRCCGIAGN